MLSEEQLRRFQDYDVILAPDRDVPEWWAGAPSVLRGGDGRFHLAARMREGDSPRGRRGYEVRILSSDDGISFEPVASVRREDVPIGVFERPALVGPPGAEGFRLYVCGPWREGPWCIMRLEDVADPGDFDAASCRPVLTPADCGPAGPEALKDPFVIHTAGRYHMLVIGLKDGFERTYHFTSDDGDDWQPAGEGPAFDLGGWHDYFTRPACLLPVGVGYLLVYEGSSADWRDPVYNIATGLAWTTNLEHFTDLTPAAPLLRSTTPSDYHTWRYSHWLWVGEELWAYAEVARPNNTNEIRLFRLPRQ